MFECLYSIFARFLVGLIVPLIIFYLITRSEVFERIYTSGHIQQLDHTRLSLLFSVFSAFDILWNYTGNNSTVNMSLIYLVIIAFLGNKIAIICILLINSVVYCFISDFSTFLTIFIFNVVSCLIVYNFSKYAKKKRFVNLHMLVLIIVLSSLYIVYHSVFTEQQLFFKYKLEDFCVPVIISFAFGMMAFLKILEDTLSQQKYWEGTTAKITLDIVSQSLNILQTGLDANTSQAFSETILTHLKNFDFVSITDRKTIKSISCYSKETDFIHFLETDLLEILNNGLEHNIALQVIRSYSVGVLREGSNKIIGYIIAGHILQYSSTQYEIKIIESMASLVSEQLRIHKLNEMEKNLSVAEIKALQAQIDSHFLFNALNTISYYCSSNPMTAKRLINHLANYYRRNISTDEQQISITKEIQHVNAYVQIELARFEGKLKVIYDIDEGDSFLLPPFILQPIVENAIKHGIRPKKSGGKIKIIIKRLHNIAHIFIKDDGVGISTEKLKKILTNENSSSIGLYNVNQRLKTLYGENYGILILSKENFGTSVHIRIPMLEV